MLPHTAFFPFAGRDDQRDRDGGRRMIGVCLNP
jgi:hypothetical protein